MLLDIGYPERKWKHYNRKGKIRQQMVTLQTRKSDKIFILNLSYFLLLTVLITFKQIVSYPNMFFVS